MKPAKLGRYQIQSELGRGAMGRVLLGYDPQIDRRVAIKIIQSFNALAGADREEARERFLREARAAGKLLHPGIVTLFDAGETNGLLYLAMEYIEGETLDAFCRPDRLLAVPVVIEMVAGAAEALGYAHGAGVVHRDIKPANLMRTSETTVKVMDFGLARGAEANLTQEGALLGTPSYMSPEQIRGQSIDGRSDLFSLAVVLYELLTGRKPFSGDSISSVIYRIVNEEARDASGAHARVAPELDAFLRRALAKRPEDRFQSGEEFAAALRDAGARMQPVDEAAAAKAVMPRAKAKSVPITQREIPPTRPRRPVRSSPRPFVLGIILLIVAVGAGAYHFREELGLLAYLKPGPVVYETKVLAEPAEATVLLDGEPLDPAMNGLVRFEGENAAPLLTAEYGCRREEYRLSPGDGGGEVRMVLEPVELDYELDLGQTAAGVELNGERLGTTPLALSLDLCRENRVVLNAEGFRDTSLEIPEAATPLEARGLLSSLALAPIPMGALLLPDSAIKLVYFVDGNRVDGSVRRLELTEGRHTVRAINNAYWIDVSGDVEVVADQEVTADLEPPPLSTLAVFAFPPNAKVDLRRPGGRWKYLDDVPVRRKLAAGRYEVRVTLKATGESRTREVNLRPGSNPDIRISFGAPS